MLIFKDKVKGKSKLMTNYISFFREIKLILFNNKWRKLNKHNYTIAANIFPIDKVCVGNYTYGPLYVESYGVNNIELSIGSFCSIASGVKFLLGAEHKTDVFLTYPINSFFFGQQDAFSKGPTIIKDDVWIGSDVTVLSGVTIGQGSVIGAGSVVSKSIPPYAIYAGGRIIRNRFDDETIEKLTRINFEKINEKYIINNHDLFCLKINDELLSTKSFKYLLGE